MMRSEPISNILTSYFLLFVFLFGTMYDSDAAVVDAGMNAQPNGHRGKTQRIRTLIFCSGEVLFEPVVSPGLFVGSAEQATTVPDLLG